jgi:MFS family permease
LVRSDELGHSEREKNLTPWVAKLTFFVVFFSNLVTNIDHGVMPAGAIVIRQDLGQSNTEYGLLGSIVFAGLVVGSLAATFIYRNIDNRVVLACVLACNALAQVCFTLTEVYYLLLLCRFMAGFFQVFMSIYWPVYTDIYTSSERQKTTWMSLFLLSAPVGVLFGYVITNIMIKRASWEYAFYVQAISVIPCMIYFLLVPLKYVTLENLIA